MRFKNFPAVRLLEDPSLFLEAQKQVREKNDPGFRRFGSPFGVVFTAGVTTLWGTLHRSAPCREGLNFAGKPSQASQGKKCASQFGPCAYKSKRFVFGNVLWNWLADSWGAGWHSPKTAARTENCEHDASDSLCAPQTTTIATTWHSHL